MINTLRKIFFLIFIIITGEVYSQEYDRIAFYNVENFFDTEYDSSKYFNGFTPEGDHHWTKSRYYQKKQNIFKVITALGGWQGVTVIGLAEIENKKVLKDLINTTPLKTFDYGIIHYESPDKRGIDLGILYLKSRFKILKSENIKVTDPQNEKFTTRDIIYVKGVVMGDTVNIFYNHWPSRYGGMMNTVRLRLLAANKLVSLIDSVCNVENSPKILILGDFNDNREDESIQYLLKSENGNIIALPWVSDYGNVKGTIKHNADWAVFDQIFVSKNLTGSNKFYVYKSKMHIFDIDFLLMKDNKNLGYKLNRTFTGFKYSGGYSDHLPVYIDLTKSK